MAQREETLEPGCCFWFADAEPLAHGEDGTISGRVQLRKQAFHVATIAVRPGFAQGQRAPGTAAGGLGEWGGFVRLNPACGEDGADLLVAERSAQHALAAVTHGGKRRTRGRGE